MPTENAPISGIIRYYQSGILSNLILIWYRYKAFTGFSCLVKHWIIISDIEMKLGQNSSLI